MDRDYITDDEGNRQPVARNEAAERLLGVIKERRHLEAREVMAIRNSLRAALAAERRATVERIRAELEAIPAREAFDSRFKPARRYLAIQREAVERILDEEAAR